MITGEQPGARGIVIIQKCYQKSDRIPKYHNKQKYHIHYLYKQVNLSLVQNISI